VKDLALQCLAKMVHRSHIYLIPKSQDPKINSVEARDFFPIFGLYQSRAMWAHKNVDPSQYVGKGGLSQTPTNNIHFHFKK
jgi:hypothetical protein